jgi:hypothetical protein
MNEQRTDFWKFSSRMVNHIVKRAIFRTTIDLSKYLKNITANLFLQYNLARKSEPHSNSKYSGLAARGRRKMFITRVNASS